MILEYTQIIKDIGKDNLILTSLPPSTTEKDIPKRLLELGLQWTTKECVDIDGGIDKSKVCLLDPAAETDLTPQDKSNLTTLFWRNIRESSRIDRTGLLREKYGFSGRRLGSLQMTTDTAIRTTQRIIENGVAFEDIKFLDYQKSSIINMNPQKCHFATLLIMRKSNFTRGMLELIKNDAEQSIDDLLIE